MPVKECTLDGKPGYKWGDAGKCYTFEPGNQNSRKEAKEKAALQGVAIGFAENDESYMLPCHEISLSEDGKLGPIQVLKVGEYQIPGHGKFKVTPTVLRTLKKGFEQRVRRIDLAFNYEHGRSKAHGSKAAGWFKSVELRENDSELWVNAEWTPGARKQILDKEYRYASGEILFNYRDNESGKVHSIVLEGAALTNKPVIKGMEAIAASEFNNDNAKGKKTMNLSEIKVNLLDNHGIDLAEIQRKADGFDAEKKKSLKLSEELESVKKENAKMKGENEGLKKKVDLSEKEKADMKFSELVKKGMDEGKLTKVMAEGTFRKMFDAQGVEFCEAYLSEAPKVVDTESAIGSDTGKRKEVDKKKSATVQLSEMAEERSKKDDISLSEAQAKVIEENPELYEAYEKELSDD